AALRTTGSGLRIFAVPMMISVAGVIVLATPVARLFASSADTAIIAAHATAQILILLAVGMPLRSGHFYLLRVFYAAENALIPMIVTAARVLCCRKCVDPHDCASRSSCRITESGLRIGAFGARGRPRLFAGNNPHCRALPAIRAHPCSGAALFRQLRSPR